MHSLFLWMAQKPLYRHLVRISLIGIFVFVGLYIVASLFYNGGNNIDKSATGFDWANNYWCELISSVGKNGQANKAYPIALTGAVVLFITLSAFWMGVPPAIISNQKISAGTSYLGVGSMVFAISMLSGQYHDLLISIAGALGVIAITILLVHLYRNNRPGLFYLGIFCVFLCGINNYVYYTGRFITYLPIIQKISFVVFLSWFTLILKHVQKEYKEPKTVVRRTP